MALEPLQRDPPSVLVAQRVKTPKTADLRFLGFFFLSPILLQADLNSGSKKDRDSEVVWDGGDGDEVQGQE
jgi:hypothetical protein